MSSINNPIIKKLIDRYHDTGKQKRHTAESREWFRKEVRRNFSNVRTARFVKESKQHSMTPHIGDLYMYDYDPKYKDELPYYDKFPMVFIVDMDSKGFLGINLHYLPPKLRLVLFTKLLTIRNEKRYRQSTKLKLSWEVLKSFSQFSLVEPCVKRYLYDHLRSRFVKVDPQAWEIMISMPVERFAKASQKQVWAESVKRKKKK